VLRPEEGRLSVLRTSLLPIPNLIPGKDSRREPEVKRFGCGRIPEGSL